MKYSLYIGAILFALCFCGCSDETLVDGKTDGEGALLNMYASVATANTRLAELPLKQISENNKGKKDVGLYIYYEDDYNADDLSKPYIRNLRCTVTDGKLVAESNQDIYIYDRMTIVAFYPYNEDMSKDDNYFTKKKNEKAYPITESDYSQQTYIPYRAQTNVNPTIAYMIELHFKPQQTCKVEVVLVADSRNDFPTHEDSYKTKGDIELLPSVDRYDGNYVSTTGDLRENWVDNIEDFPELTESGRGTDDGGKYVRRYTAYVWKSQKDDPHHDDSHKHNNNKLSKGDRLFVSDKLILTIPHDLDLAEETVYRYGYNLNTGEIFIPTSDRLVYDATSLQEVSFNEYRAYQVCDIDLTGKGWDPKTVYRGTYDGGGHKISNLSITATPASNVSTEPDKQSFGLFESITSESTLMNIDLVNPKITVDYSNAALKDTCYVGALCGIVNPELSDAKKREMILDGLPKELSTAVKEALIQEGMKNFANTTCYIRGCKVTDPVITVKGENVRVGGLCGGAGNQKQKAEIKDSYVWQSPGNASYQGIAVNAADEDNTKYSAAYAGGFCGMLANGSITNCYSTIENIHAYVKETVTGGTTSPKDIAEGFCTLAPEKEKGAATVSGCYTKKKDSNTDVTNFNAGWPASWPLFKDDQTVSNDGTNSGTSGVNYPGAYPAYQWTDSWHDMGTSNTSYPTLVWEHPLIQKI